MGNCSCNALSWPEGNDVLLKVRVFEKKLVGDEPVEQGFDLTVCDEVTARVAGGLRKKVVFESAIDNDENNCLLVRLPYTLTRGEYSLEVKAVRNGFHVRSFDVRFTIVERDCQARTTFSEVDGCNSAALRVTLQIVPQAMTRGKSAYEEWLEQPGNEGKTMDDFIAWLTAVDDVEVMTADDATALFNEIFNQ